MGLIRKGAAALAAAGFLCAAGLSAAPRLRLVSSTVGPVSIAQGANGGAQTVEAYNDADGSLNLKLSPSVSWIAGSVGAQRTCSPPQPAPRRLYGSDPLEGSLLIRPDVTDGQNDQEHRHFGYAKPL